MELNIKETSVNLKTVTFTDTDDDSADVEDIGYVDENSVFVEAIVPKPPNVGKFKTIESGGRVNAPMDKTLTNRKVPVAPPPKKKLTYDDILSSMSMQVGPDGKLQMHSEKLHQHRLEQQQQQQQNTGQPQQQASFSPENRVPMTKRQYKQMIVMEMIRRQQQAARIREIKSTKLVFPSTDVTIRARQGVNLNRFFKLK